LPLPVPIGSAHALAEPLYLMYWKTSASIAMTISWFARSFAPFSVLTWNSTLYVSLPFAAYFTPESTRPRILAVYGSSSSELLVLDVVELLLVDVLVLVDVLSELLVLDDVELLLVDVLVLVDVLSELLVDVDVELLLDDVLVLVDVLSELLDDVDVDVLELDTSVLLLSLDDALLDVGGAPAPTSISTIGFLMLSGNSGLL